MDLGIDGVRCHAALWPPYPTKCTWSHKDATAITALPLRLLLPLLRLTTLGLLRWDCWQARLGPRRTPECLCLIKE